MADFDLDSPVLTPNAGTPAPEVVDAVADGSDKENRKALEDMFADDSDEEDFKSSAPQSSIDAPSQEQL